MRQVLPYDYDVIVDNMIPFTKDQAIEGWGVFPTEFYSFKEKKEVTMFVLANDDDKQIFQMKDGRFVLEVEILDEGDVEYFYSENLQDLL